MQFFSSYKGIWYKWQPAFSWKGWIISYCCLGIWVLWKGLSSTKSFEPKYYRTHEEITKGYYGLNTAVIEVLGTFSDKTVLKHGFLRTWQEANWKTHPKRTICWRKNLCYGFLTLAAPVGTVWKETVYHLRALTSWKNLTLHGLFTHW